MGLALIVGKASVKAGSPSKLAVIGNIGRCLIGVIFASFTASPKLRYTAGIRFECKLQVVIIHDPVTECEYCPGSSHQSDTSCF